MFRKIRLKVNVTGPDKIWPGVRTVELGGGALSRFLSPSETCEQTYVPIPPFFVEVDFGRRRSLMCFSQSRSCPVSQRFLVFVAKMRLCVGEEADTIQTATRPQ